MSKPAFCICENKGADYLRDNSFYRDAAHPFCLTSSLVAGAKD